MPVCDICGKSASLEDYCHIAVMPNPTQPKGWYMLTKDKKGDSEKIADSNPAATDIAKRLGEAFTKQPDVRENQTKVQGPKNMPALFVTVSGKLYFCNDCVKGNGGTITKAGIRYAKGKAKKRSRGWWPF